MRKRFVCSGWLTLLLETKRTQFVKVVALPSSCQSAKDAIEGALLIKYLAVIYAWTGEKDLAFEQLTRRGEASRFPKLW